MKRIVTLVAVACAAVLAACTTVAPTQVNHYQMTLPDFPSLLVSPSDIAPPPDQKTYLATSTSWQQREAMWLTAYSQQTTNVMTCNIDKSNIQAWWTQQEQVVVQTNAANGTSPAASGPVAASAPKASQ
jgi:hypothetical protein